jgi:predicted O-linked N-acetylglucosamine transferase (SPINDLY family)
MEDFLLLYESYLQNPTNISKHIYSIGIKQITSTNNVTQQEDILSKLIFIFPQNYELYYYMGHIHINKNISKAMTWFRICLLHSPNDVENILDLTKILFDNDYTEYIWKLDKEFGFFSKYNYDIRIRLLHGVMLIKESKLYDALSVFKDLLSFIERTPTLPQTIKNLIYENTAHTFSRLAEPYIAVEYMNKIVGMQNKNYNNIFLINDYIYHNVKKRSKIKNDSYTTTNFYSFDRRKYIESPRKINIGYVSSGFVNDAVSNFIKPIIMNHDYSKFNVCLFVQNKYHETMTVYKNRNINVFNTKGLTETDGADLVYQNNIDILIDLNGYTEINRLDIFSKNPAPIQMTYIGYPNSLNLSFIKYRITDRIADHENSEQVYTEQLLKLPRCFLLFNSTIQKQKISPREKDFILFGSLNKENKNGREVLECWREIMHKTFNTKILIKLNSKDNINERKTFYKNKLDIDDNRMILLEPCSDEKYIETFSMIDILLDTFPYSGTTTTCNSLYNSVPIVTLYHKDYHVHNVSSSILMNSGFPELVCYDKESYVQKAIELSKDPIKIRQYKSEIHDKFCELMDPKKFMPDYENLLETTFLSSN